MLDCLLAAVPALLVAAPPVEARPLFDNMSFEELNEAFLEARAPKGTKASEFPIDEVVAKHYVTVVLGPFELACSLEQLKDKRSSEFPQLAEALLDLEVYWADAFAVNDESRAAIRAEIEILRGWIQEWSKGALTSLSRGEAGEMLALLDASEEVRQASARLAALSISDEHLTMHPRHIAGVRLLMSPTRRDFMEFVGYAGSAYPAKRTELWHDGIDQWTVFWIERTVIIAGEYAPWNVDPKFKTGLPMNKFDKDGLRQHFLMQAARALVMTSINRTDLPLLEKGLSLNCAISVCGRANTIDGEGAISSTGASTAPYERFVPGGNPNGGVLPAIPAAPFNAVVENHWRKGNGDDWFLKPLKAGQKAGAKRARKEVDGPLARNELPHFELEGESGSKTVVSAPFVGDLAREQEYPEEQYLNEYREFFRSYLSAFLHWLDSAAVPEGADASHAKLTELLVAIASTGGNLPFDEAAKAVYGVPLSSRDGSDSLEWRFLAWLAGD